LLLNLNLLEMQMYQRYSNDLHIHQAHACLLQQCCHDSLLLFIWHDALLLCMGHDGSLLNAAVERNF